MITAVVTIIMFLIMVSLHEFGHFIVAKKLGFKILEYSIGFGPTIWKSKKTQIQYSIRAIPLGGYCKFEGEDENSEDPGAFNKQPVWKRILVVAAGGVSNIILGFLLFLIIVPLTSPMLTNTISSIVEHSYIEQAGLAPGDEIISINGHGISFYDDITLYTQDFKKDTQAEIIVKRAGEKIKFDIKPTEQIITENYTDSGIEYIELINGYETKEFYEYNDKLVKDDAKVGESNTVTRYLIGFTPEKKDVTLLNVWGQVWNETRFVVKLVYQSLWGMITGRIGVDQMSGPVGIVSEVNNAVNSGSKSWLYVMNLMALLTINLGVFNLLPIPALDGGRLFFMVVEIIRRKPIPPEKEGTVHAIGMLLLIAFIIFVSFNDVMRLIQ